MPEADSQPESPVEPPSQQPIQILDYRSAPTPRGEFDSMDVVLPFGGAILFVMLMLVAFEQAWRHAWVAVFAAWGLSGALLIAIVIRQARFALKPKGRPWWVHAIAGIVNLVADWIIVEQTTGRQNYSRTLGENGTRLLGIALALATAYVIATLLTPRQRNLPP